MLIDFRGRKEELKIMCDEEYKIYFERAVEILKNEGKKVTAEQVALKMKELGAKRTMIDISNAPGIGVTIRECEGKKRIVVRGTKNVKKIKKVNNKV